MSYNIKSKYLVIAILIALCGIFFGGWYIGAQKVKTASNATQNALKDTIEKLTVQINDTEYHLARTEQELITERQLRKQDVIDKETLKVLNTKHVKEISKLKFRIDTLLEDVNNSGEVIIIHDTITLEPKSYVKLPFVVTKYDQWLSLKDSTDIRGKTFIALKIDSIGVDVISSIDEKSKKNTISILTDCPYIQTIGVRSYKTDVQKPKRYGMGLQAGYGITSRSGLSPYVGVGISYNLIVW